MANLKPFQVIVTFEDPNGEESKKEYGFNTIMERRIYLWGVRDAAGSKIADVKEVNYKPPCMACNSRPIEKTYLRGGSVLRGFFVVVELCEPCSKDIIMLATPYLAEGGGRLVSEEETFGLTKFEDLVREAGLPED